MKMRPVYEQKQITDDQNRKMNVLYAIENQSSNENFF